jgi:hypothetical protein
VINYYDILGIKISADYLEIKMAFRQLAKRYHPDKNPGGKDTFTLILKAYEVLSNPNLKSSYDYKLKSHLTQGHPSTTLNVKQTKTWRFDERELKRRQYYNDYIKKHAATHPQASTGGTIKTSYNEYKYVLFATPLAVALFLLIVNLAAPQKVKKGMPNEPQKQTKSAFLTLDTNLKMNNISVSHSP